MPSLNDAAANLLTSMQAVPPREPGQQLRAADEARILELHASGHTQTDIARAVGCHQSTVSRTLAEYDDSRPLARKYLEARALEMTKRLVSDARPETILRVLAKLDVVRDDGAGSGGEETVLHIGNGGMVFAQFTDNDVIVYVPSSIPSRLGEGPRPKELKVQRSLGPGTITSFDLPCPVSEIPPHVKITPEAAKYIREQLRPVIEASAVGEYVDGS